MKTHPSIRNSVAACLALLSGIGAARAATISLIANDSVGTTSFNVAGHWSNAAAPTAGNDYNTAGFFMRSPGMGSRATRLRAALSRWERPIFRAA